MTKIKNYVIQSKIYETMKNVIYRGNEKKHSNPVIFKVIKEDFIINHGPATFLDEHSLITKLKSENLFKPVSIDPHSLNSIMVFKHFPGQPLKDLIDKHTFTVREVLAIGLSVMKILKEINAENMIHTDINPYNIFYDLKSHKTKLLDLSYSVKLTQADRLWEKKEINHRVLPYIPPELNGSIHQKITSSCDYYSLGIILYELLAKKLPWTDNDPFKQFNSYAFKPPSLLKLNPSVPKILSDIINKLLMKDPLERYQSATSAIHDLTICSNYLDNLNAISNFKIAQFDRMTYHESPRLYGRKKDQDLFIKIMKRSFNNSNKQLLFVIGPAGVGKTAFVTETFRNILNTLHNRANTVFIQTKFQQGKLGKPYYVIRDILTKLIHMILSESENDLSYWKNKFNDSLGPNGYMLFTMIPEIELIIGPQEPFPIDSSITSKNRFTYAILTFFRVLSGANYSLVLFLDDVQWIDTESADLLKLIIEDEFIQNLFPILVFREYKPGTQDLLSEMIRHLENIAIETEKINLYPLTRKDIQQLISDSFLMTHETGTTLAELLHKLSSGYPIIIKTLLKTLLEKNLIRFDFRTGMHYLKENELPFHMEFSDVILEKIRQLPPDSLEILKIASCFGFQFDANTIATIGKKSIEEVKTILNGRNVRDVIRSLSDNNNSALYTFSHDRIFEVILSIIPESEKKAVHHSIGTVLTEAFQAGNTQVDIFHVVKHLNLGSDLIQGHEGLYSLAELNLQATQAAIKTVALTQAFQFCEKGIDIVPYNCWDKKYELTVKLYENLFELSFVNNQYDILEKSFWGIIHKIKSLDLKVKIFGCYINCLNLQKRSDKVISLQNNISDLFNIKIPKIPRKISRIHLFVTYLKTRIQLSGKSLSHMCNRKSRDNPKLTAIIKILNNFAWSYRYTDPVMGYYLVLKKLSLAYKLGTGPLLAKACMDYAIALGYFDKYTLSNKFGIISMKIIKLYSNSYNYIDYKSDYCRFIEWKNHFSKGILRLEKLSRQMINLGNYIQVRYSMEFYFILICNTSNDLQIAAGKMEKWITNLKMINQKDIDQHLIEYQAVLNLQGKSANPLKLTGAFIDEDKTLQKYKRGDNILYTCLLYDKKIMLYYLFEEYRSANEAVEKIKDNAEIYGGMIFIYESLVKCALFEKSSKASRRYFLKRIKYNQKTLKKWSDYSPVNYLSLYFLVIAELNRILKRRKSAELYYEKSIDAARKNDYLRYEALGNELYAKYFVSIGKVTIAGAYMTKARNLYLKWKAVSKVRHLEKKYPNLIINSATDSLYSENKKNVDTFFTLAKFSNKIDLTTIMKASKVIAHELNIPKLLKNLTNIVAENTGAQKGVLIFKKGENMEIEAFIYRNGEKDYLDKKIKGTPFNQYQDIPHGLIAYVSRTKKKIVINNSLRDNSFLHDTYIARKKPKSIICLPIIHHASLIGIFYLENKDMVSAFTPHRIEVLQTISEILANAWIKKEAEIKIQNYQNKLRQMSSELLLTEERERRIIAVDLHDRIGHALTSSKLKLHMLRRKLFHANENVWLNDTIDLIEQSIRDVRTLTFDLSPPILYDFGLNSAIDWLVEQFQKKHGLTINLKFPPQVNIENTSMRILIFRSIRELLFNIVKHAHAQNVSIVFTTHNDSLAITVTDDGIGFNVSEIDFNSKNCFGLFSIKERLASMGGTLKIDTNFQKGTRITISTPLIEQAS